MCRRGGLSSARTTTYSQGVKRLERGAKGPALERGEGMNHRKSGSQKKKGD